MNVIEQSIQAYQKHQHLKLAAKDVGIPWQTLYVHLKRAGIPVTGNKAKYGSDKDKLATMAEQEFKRILPAAIDQNNLSFQSKIDFMVGEYGVDIKASRLRKQSKTSKVLRWAFSVKKQEVFADFFVCFAFDSTGNEVLKMLLIPYEVARYHSSISLSSNYGKWSDYEVSKDELYSFFTEMIKIPKNKIQEHDLQKDSICTT